MALAKKKVSPHICIPPRSVVKRPTNMTNIIHQVIQGVVPMLVKPLPIKMRWVYPSSKCSKKGRLKFSEVMRQIPLRQQRISIC
jgi:hypothetical protein